MGAVAPSRINCLKIYSYSVSIGVIPGNLPLARRKGFRILFFRFPSRLCLYKAPSTMVIARALSFVKSGFFNNSFAYGQGILRPGNFRLTELADGTGKQVQIKAVRNPLVIWRFPIGSIFSSTCETGCNAATVAGYHNPPSAITGDSSIITSSPNTSAVRMSQTTWYCCATPAIWTSINRENSPFCCRPYRRNFPACSAMPCLIP